MARYLGDKLIASVGGGYHPNIFECKWSDHIINDIQWLRADTFSWQEGMVYTTAYDKLVEEWNSGVEEIEYKKGSLINIATQSNAISNADYSSYVKANAFDGSTSSKWNSSTSAYLKTSYIGQRNLTKKIKKIRLYQSTFDSYDRSITSIVVKYSNDNGSTWNDIQTISTPNALNTWQEFDLVDYNADLNGYSLALWSNSDIVGGSGGSWCVAELEMYAYEYVNYITFRRTTNGFKIADATQEANILAKYNTDGISWYYILDRENRRFKLPRTKFGFEGLRDNVGNDIAESLPNDNAPVQERATQMYLYFYVGEYTREAIEQTAGLNSEMFNSKVDTSSLSEINPMIESFVDGASGYNIWANGYCEQWGLYGGINATINFLKTFKDTNYVVTNSINTTSSDTCLYSAMSHSNKTVSSINFPNTGGVTNCSWKVCGYLAEGEYTPKTIKGVQQ